MFTLTMFVLWSSSYHTKMLSVLFENFLPSLKCQFWWTTSPHWSTTDDFPPALPGTQLFLFHPPYLECDIDGPPSILRHVYYWSTHPPWNTSVHGLPSLPGTRLLMFHPPSLEYVCWRSTPPPWNTTIDGPPTFPAHVYWWSPALPGIHLLMVNRTWNTTIDVPPILSGTQLLMVHPSSLEYGYWWSTHHYG